MGRWEGGGGVKVGVGVLSEIHFYLWKPCVQLRECLGYSEVVEISVFEKSPLLCSFRLYRLLDR